MNLAIIGRTEWLYESAQLLRRSGHTIRLVVTSPQAPEYRRTPEDFRRLADDCGAEFVHAARLEGADVQAAISRGGDLDVGISMNFPTVISRPVIQRFRLGILNAHGGDLPRYRGNACQAWAMLNGESRIGLCIHRMVGGELDTGDIVARSYRPLAIDDRIGEIFAWMAQETPRLFNDAVGSLAVDPQYALERQSSNPAEALRCYTRTPDDARIDWTQSAEQVLRLINASSEPFPGAFCFHQGCRLTIWRARLHADEEKYLAIAGQVAAIDPVDGSVVVICGAGKIRLTEVSCNDERVPPATLIRSTRSRLVSHESDGTAA